MRAIVLLIGPPSLDRPLPTRPPEDGLVCCGSGPMVTTSPQPVHASLPEYPASCSSDGCDRWVRTGAAPTEERPVSEAGTSLAALVRAAARRSPEAPAVVAGHERLTWAELDAAVDRAAAGYAALGLTAGDRVAVQLPNGLDWVRAAVGALRAGLVVVPVNTAYTDPELEYVLVDSGAVLLVVATDRAPVAGVRVCAGPPQGDGPAPQVAENPAATVLPGLHERHHGAPARCDPDRGRAARQPGTVPGADAAAGPLRRPRAAGPAAVPRLRPERRLRPGRRHRRLRGAAGDLRPPGLADAHGRGARDGGPRRPADVPGLARRGRRRRQRRRAPPRVRRHADGLLGRRPAAGGDLDGDARPRRRHGLGGLRPHRGLPGRRQHPRHRPRQAELHRRPAARRRARTARHRHHRVRRGDPTRTTSRARGRSGCAAPTCSPATGPTAPTGRARTAGWAPATSPTATPTATCTSSTGAATSSWSAASTSTRPRSSGSSTPIPPSPRAR